MFYEVLMEKKAQRAQQDENTRGLSTGQKAGVVGVGLAGAVAPAVGAAYSKPTSAFVKFLENNKYNRKADALRTESQGIKAKYQKQLDPIQAEMDRLQSAQAGYTEQLLGTRNVERRKIQLERAKVDELLDAATRRYDDVIKERDALRGNLTKGIQEMDALGFKARRTKLLGTMGLTGLAAGYGAKKLFDRYNARKQ